MSNSNNNGETKKATYLNPVGGYLWEKSTDTSHPNYREQEYLFKNETQVRKGITHDDKLGKVTDVRVVDGTYGEGLTVKLNTADGDFILSMGTGNARANQMFCALLNMDLDKEILVRHYEFEGTDKVTKEKNGKIISGLTFLQDGQKVNARDVVGMPPKDPNFFDRKKFAVAKQKMYYMVLTEWFKDELNERVIPNLDGAVKADEPIKEAIEPISAPVSEPKKVGALGMKRAIKAYIAVNYSDEVIPSGLKGDELVTWYKLVLSEDELPFEVSVSEPLIDEPKDIVDALDLDDLDKEFEDMGL